MSSEKSVKSRGKYSNKGGKTRASSDENDGVDLYETPPDTTRDLLNVLQLAEGTLIFECCAGNLPLPMF